LVFFSIFQYDERDFKNDFVDICSVRRYRWSRVSQQRYKKSKKVKKRLDLYGKSLVYSDMTKGEKMTNKEILNYLELITGELTDAYHITDTYGDVDANYSIHSAQELIDELRDNLEGKFDDDMSIFSENAFAGDGEGRLKGNN